MFHFFAVLAGAQVAKIIGSWPIFTEKSWNFRFGGTLRHLTVVGVLPWPSLKSLNNSDNEPGRKPV